MADSTEKANLKQTVEMDYARIAEEFGRARKPLYITFVVCILASFLGSFTGAVFATLLWRNR